MKNIVKTLGIVSACALCLISCKNQTDTNNLSTSIILDTNISTDIIDFEETDYYTAPVEETSTKIELTGSSANITGNGAIVNGNIITITAGGTYIISGTLDNGQIVVNANNADVTIALNNANITYNSDAPIYVAKANKVNLSLVENSVNTITDSANYSATTEATAAIYSKSDLTINGSGTLNVNANYNNGIQSKDSLKILIGTININSIDDGIIGKDMLQILDGNITIDAGGDGIKSTNDTDTSLGYISVQNGKLKITAGADGIQAKTNIIIDGGEFNITTGGGSTNSSSTHSNSWGNWKNPKVTTTEDTSTSAKALKASSNILITSGMFTIDSADDSIHSNNTIIIENGNFTITSGDDGIHADTALSINGSIININKSYEGIESSSITISDGEINITASDDGINVAGGNDNSSLSGRPGQNNFNTSNNNQLYISGGNITVNATGDGIDVNGSAYVSGGTITIYGPTSGGNGILDYDKSFEVSGGELIASGSAEMLQTISSSSQCGLVISFPTSYKSSTSFVIKDSNGNEIISTTPIKDYRAMIISSSELKTGETYKIYVGDTEYTEFTINSTITKISNGNSSNMGSGGMKGDKNMNNNMTKPSRKPDGSF